MKNQYVGDVGDYGKYSLLRFIALHGIRIGVNWYLTENDESTDGKFTDYVKKDSEGCYDQDVFAVMRSIVGQNDRSQRTVQMIQDAELIPEALYFDEKLNFNKMIPTERAWDRRVWFERSISVLRDAELIFADPDNGITYRKTSRNKGCEKYVLPEEIALYYYGGKDVVFYSHKGRRTDEAWKRMILRIKESVCDAKLFVLTFHRGTQRSYIFVVHPERAEQYESLLAEFITSSEWGKSGGFTREYLAESSTDLTPDICRKWVVLDYFQKAFRTNTEIETALKRMTIEQIEELIDAGLMAKQFYYDARKRRGTEFAAPTIGTLYPKGTTIQYKEDGKIIIVPPADKLQ